MSDDSKVDVAIVGAGLAGLACAWKLAGEGLGVLVLERGDAPGSKNVSGGRLYLNALRAMEPELVDGLPLERRVTRESLCLVSGDASTTIQFRGDRLAEDPAHSATVLRGTLDAHLGEKVGERGGFVIPATPVRELTMEGSRVTGVIAGEETFPADCVVLADGALSFLAAQAGLHARLDAADFAVGIKEVWALDRGVIEDRFALEGDQGEARLFLGAVSDGQVGGGFLYTNRESVSLGLVVGIGAYRDAAATARTSELIEAFTARPEIRPLLAGGKRVEYSAHVIPEGGLDAAPRRVGDGVLLAGDAAGLALNHGVTVRGMDTALASGLLAAQAFLEAKAAGDFSATGLSAYDRLIEASFVGQDLATFRHAPAVLGRPRFYQHYPDAVNRMLGDVFWFGDGPKARLFGTAWAEVSRSFLNFDTLSDAWEAKKL